MQNKEQHIPKMELASVLKSVKAISTKEQFEKVAELMINGHDKEAVLSAVNGLSEEDEFAFLTKLMGTATHIIGLNQRQITEGDYTIPDFIINFKAACFVEQIPEQRNFKCLVDVKTTDKDIIKIGGKELKKLRNFADLMNLPLVFAARFLKFGNNAVWVMVEDKREDTFIHINYSDLEFGIRTILWDEYFCALNPLLTIRAIYEKNPTRKGAAKREFGECVKLELEVPETDLHRHSLAHIERFADIVFYLEILKTFELQELRTEKIDENITHVYYCLTEPRFLADILFKINNFMRDEFGRITFSALRLASKYHHNNLILSREMVQNFLKPLLDNRIILPYHIGDNHKERWETLMK